MTGCKRKDWLLGLGLATMALSALPAQAQESSAAATSAATTIAPNPLDNKKVSLHVEEVTLATAVKTLMTGVGAEFTIDEALNEAYVTAKLTNIRLKVALDTLCKACTLPVTYRVENSVYRFMPKTDPPPAPPPVVTPKRAPQQVTPERIQVNEQKARRILDILNGDRGSYQVLNGNLNGGDLQRRGETTFFGIINGQVVVGGSTTNGRVNRNGSQQSSGGGAFSLGNILGMLFGNRRGR